MQWDYTVNVKHEWLKTVGEKFMDAGNLSFGGLIVGQLITKDLQGDRTLLGAIMWLGGYAIGSYCMTLYHKLSQTRKDNHNG